MFVLHTYSKSVFKCNYNNHVDLSNWIFHLKYSDKTRGNDGGEREWEDEDEQKHKKSNIDGEGTY